MDTCQLDVLHDGRHIGVGAVTDGICLALEGVIQEPVNEDRSVGSYADSCLHVVGHGLIVVDHFHAPSAENVRRTHHNRIADALCNRDGFVHGGCHAGFRHRDAQLVHHAAEQVAVLCQVDDLRGGAENADAVLLQVRSQIQRGLSAELGNDAYRLLLVVDAEYILQGQRLEVELVGGVVVSGYGLRVAVDDDGLKTESLQGLGRMYAAVVKLDTLADTVGAAAEDHDLRAVVLNRVIVRCIVGGIVVGAVVGTADVYAVPGLGDAQRFALIADIVLRDAEDLA